MINNDGWLMNSSGINYTNQYNGEYHNPHPFQQTISRSVLSGNLPARCMLWEINLLFYAFFWFVLPWKPVKLSEDNWCFRIFETFWNKHQLYIIWKMDCCNETSVTMFFKPQNGSLLMKLLDLRFGSTIETLDGRLT